MKYLIINDFHFIKKNRIGLLLFCLVALFIGIFFKLSTGYLKSDYTFYSALGLKFEIHDIISLLIFLIQPVLLVILTVDIISKDISNNMANIFLRIDVTKWIISKFVTIILFNFILKIVVYFFAISIDLFIHSFYYINNCEYVLIWYFKDYFTTLCICLFSLMIYIITLSNKNKISFIIVMVLAFFLYYRKMNPINVNLIFFIVAIMILQFLIIVISWFKRKEILERWN